MRRSGDPAAWGDPIYRQRHVEMNVYRGIADVIICYYTIDELHREVYVTRIVANPQSPLGESGYLYP